MLVSGVYDLFPQRPRAVAVEVEGAWPDEYPFWGKLGVYVQFGETMEVARIGRALDSILAERLNAYFWYASGKRSGGPCKIREKWDVPPRFLVLAALEDGEPRWHIPAIEAFLLERFNPLIAVDMPDPAFRNDSKLTCRGRCKSFIARFSNPQGWRGRDNPLPVSHQLLISRKHPPPAQTVLPENNLDSGASNQPPPPRSHRLGREGCRRENRIRRTGV